MTRVPTPVESFFETLTTWVGSVPSLIAHTLVFAGSFAIAFLGYADFDRVLLMVTTIVSLEAIYLAIFIQMTVNRQSKELHDVSEDVEEIQEEVEEISKDVDEISEDVEEISKDVEEIGEDVEEIQEDVEEMSEDWDLDPKSSATESAESLRKQLKEILAKLEAMNEKP
jgi:uncharacterized protein YoxC